MKTKNLCAVISFATLSAIAGSAVAGAHDGYYHAFYGQSDTAREMVGKAAYGTPSGNAWNGHEAYQRALGGGDASPATHVEIMGKAAYGTTSGPDGNANYRRSFAGD